jgi:hypothetical protein
MFYDQPFEHHPDYGFIDRGYPADATHHEALQLVAEVRQLLLARDPQAVVIGEESDIHATPYIDQWMSWSISAPSPELVERVAMMRYAMPHTILSWVVDHELERATIAFAMGMQLCLMVHGAEATLAEEPEFANRIRALADLRKMTAAWTVMAQFRGQRGLSIDGDDAFTAWVYTTPAAAAVITAACGHGAKGKVTVTPESYALEKPRAEGRVICLDGSQEVQPGLVREFDLARNEVQVWVL